MSLLAQALPEFELPVAPQRMDELPTCLPGSEAFRVHAPAGRFLGICSNSALAGALQATLLHPLAGARYPAPPPPRARGRPLNPPPHSPPAPGPSSARLPL